MSAAATISQDFSSFLEKIKEPGSVTALSPSRLANELEIQMQDFAALAKVHRNTMTSAPTSPKVQSAVRDVVKVLSAAFELTGDMPKALFWFRNTPLAEFGHSTAFELVESGKAQAVIAYLESRSAGASG